jgi:hypothetical protein
MSVTLLTVLSGGMAVGLVLGLVGGGGSILAVPLLLYVVGMPSAHAALGTSAVAVALSALANLIGAMARGLVKWPLRPDISRWPASQVLPWCSGRAGGPRCQTHSRSLAA